MANRKTKVVDEPRVPGVPTDLVTFNTIAWEAPRPKGVCFESVRYPQRDRRTYGFAVASDADVFFREVNSGSHSLFPADAERRTFANREEAIAVCDGMNKYWRAY